MYKTKRTLSDCCAEVMHDCENAVSDIDVYRGAVQSYFPNADIVFKMEITINGDCPSDDELNREPKHKAVETKPRRQPKHNKTKSELPKPSTSQTVKKPEKTADTMQLTLF